MLCAQCYALEPHRLSATCNYLQATSFTTIHDLRAMRSKLSATSLELERHPPASLCLVAHALSTAPDARPTMPAAQGDEPRAWRVASELYVKSLVCTRADSSEQILIAIGRWQYWRDVEQLAFRRHGLSGMDRG